MNFVTLILAVVVFGVIMAFMGIGVLLRGRCLRGSCGGEDAIGPDGELLTCDTCPRRKELESQDDAKDQTHAAKTG